MTSYKILLIFLLFQAGSFLLSRVLLLVAVNESWTPIGYLGLGGEVAALSDFVLAGVQIQPFVLQNLAIYNINCMTTAQFPIIS
jgi:hypothetical protein